MPQLRIGSLGQLQHPALVPYENRSPWLLAYDAASLPLAAEVGEGVALQLLQQYGLDHARVALFEAIPSPHFTQLKRLFAASEQRWGEQLFTAKDCLKRLTDLEELVHRRFALLAQAGAADILTYNANAARAEPILYLLLNGLGNAIAEPQPLQQLETLCRQGAAVGIIPLLLHNTQEQTDLQLPDARRKALQSFWQTVYPQSVGLDMRGQVQPLNIPSELWRLLQRFGLQVGVGQLSKSWAGNLLAATQQAQDNNGESDFLHSRIGLAGANPAYFSMGEKSDAYHALIGGATRTGKTTLLNNLILNACEAYSPQHLQLTLMDFKDGVSFWEYADLGHVAALYAPTEADFPAALQCLAQFEQQISTRYAQFRTERVARLADYNNVSAQPLPRCLLVVDEVQSLFEGRDYQQKSEVKRILSNIAKKGAAAGVHMILSTQSFQNVELEGDVKDQFHLRIGLRHASAIGCRALMGRDNDAMLNLERFTAIYNSHQGESQHNRLVALDGLPDFHARLDNLKAQYPATACHQSSLNEPLAQTTPVATSKFADGDVSEPW
ncbi:AAA family ATPase [Thiothrix subterranea]|uniref:FtsK/SpoIIIE domain-containing protein n=1 Tax=Thiothrix subterranea TaxID=2735563 RepID=UPI00192AB9CF|nr:FtsK/SpoIIIE domain-containing protein [Thiothrix subterranea]QQZ27776.1 AAA family ATPase [Thiothrix subterranea]